MNRNPPAPGPPSRNERSATERQKSRPRYYHVTDLQSLNAYRGLIINQYGRVTEIAHGTAGYAWTSNGAAADPTWQAPGILTPAGVAQTAVHLYGGTGAPNNAQGADGDFYFRSDGGAGTAIYQKRTGAWVGIV